MFPPIRRLGSDDVQSVRQHRARENMKRRWILGLSTVGLLTGLLCGTVAFVQAEPKSQRGDAARGKILFVRHCIGCHGPEGGGDGYKFLSGPDPANLTSPSIRPPPIPTCSKRFMRANRTCRRGTLVSLRKRAATYWPMCGPWPSDATRSASLSAWVAGERKIGLRLRCRAFMLDRARSVWKFHFT